MSFEKERKPYSVLASVFNTTMIREKEIVLNHWTKERLRVFFRSNANTNSQGAKAMLYYMAGEGIKEGTLVDINDKVYLSLNQDSVENEIYKKSDLFECNMSINTFSDGYELSIPCFAYLLTSIFGNNYPQISVVSGNMQLITEDCEVSRKISVNSRFEDMGAEFIVEDRIIRNSIMNFYITKQADINPPERKLDITPRVEYQLGKNEPISVTAKRREANSSLWATVKNPTIVWES